MGPAAAVGGVMAASAIMGGIDKKKEAKSADKASKKTRTETLAYASPENFLNLYKQYAPMFQEMYMPGLQNISEALALGEMTGMHGIDTDAGRRGLTGSGVHLAMRQGQRTSRQANYNQALRDFYARSMSAAREEAGRTQAGQISASMGAPYTYTPRPGWGQIGMQAGSDFLGGYAGYKSFTGGTNSWDDFFGPKKSRPSEPGPYDLGFE